MKLKFELIRGGRFTYLGSIFCFSTGAAILWISISSQLHWLVFLFGLCFGLVLMGIAGYEARAQALGLPPPFTNDPLGWRKAKQSYKQDEGQESKGDDSTS
jgi:hypothetical protein